MMPGNQLMEHRYQSDLPTCLKMKREHNTMLIGLLGTILLGLSTYVLMTIVELQVHLGMLTEEIMSIDKQIGRIYNHMDRLTK